MHDLLNGMILDGVLQPCEQGEPTAALKHLQYCQPGDLIVYDRCYASFNMVHLHQQKHLHVLMRVRSDFSHQVQSFAQSPIRDTIIMMPSPKNSSVKNKAYQEGEQLEVRLVKYTLDNGEQAILLTTLLDQQQYCLDFLKQIYGKRWGVETRYDVLKNVLQLEYFSGYTQQAILQDFYISLFLMNMQVLLAEEVEQEIKQKYAHRKYQYQVNVTLAIGHLKKSVVRLFLCKHVDEILAELKESFLQHVEPVRPGRKFPRWKDKYRTRKKPILMKNRKNVL